jgi:undecaprenyl-diphosphatase
MDDFQAFLLGALQGLGEFLPISSSGHLIVVPWLLGWPDHELAFDVALHVGTLVAVLYAFAGQWWRLAAAGVSDLAAGRPFASRDGQLLLRLAVATVPGAVAGLFLDDWVETVFRDPIVVAASLAVMGVVLGVADRRGLGRRRVAGIPMRDAVLIGFSQALALIPGVSRSGATISAALFLGYRREDAARFSFLLAVPITVGAAILKVPELLATDDLRPVLVGIGSAAVFGLLAIRSLLAWVRTRSYMPFVYYRLALAAVLGAVILLG